MIAYKLVVGDTLSYLQDPPTGAAGAYTPAGGWTLKYRLIPRDAALSVIDLTATTAGEQYQIAAPASVTATWQAGEYNAAAWVEKGTEKYTVEPVFSQVTMLPDPRVVASGYDGRTQAQKAIDQLNEARARQATSNGTVQEYEIAGRRMKFRTVSEIDTELKYWQTVRAREVRKDAIARGMADPRFAYVRFDGHGS
jgi:hypothetical protein